MRGGAGRQREEAWEPLGRGPRAVGQDGAPGRPRWAFLAGGSGGRTLNLGVACQSEVSLDKAATSPRGLAHADGNVL